jgi:hypothetical protein
MTVLGFCPAILGCPLRGKGVGFQPISGGIFYEPTSSAVMEIDFCHGGVSDLAALRGCLRRTNPNQGAD